jgi:glycosyltransferase involved in cell wall biosynthesis
MNEGLVSVVMAVYNGESYVAKAIESILQQTYSNFEFIIVNDGSHAVVAKLLEEMADRDARIRLVVNESNIGLTKSLNRGLKIARGKFIARMDADDWSHPERLAQQIAFLQSNPKVKVVGTDVVIVDDEGKERHKVALSNFNTMRRIFRRNCLVHGSLMYDRETLQEIGGYDEEFRLAQDYDLSLRIAERFMIACLDR